MTTTIDKYIDAIKKELTRLKQDHILANEYADHLESEFEAYIYKFTDEVNKHDLEKEFVKNLEDPKVMAKSLIGEGLDLDKEVTLTNDRVSILMILNNQYAQPIKKSLLNSYNRINLSYQNHRNPVTTGFVYFILLSIVGIINIIVDLFLEVFVPQISMVSVNDGPEYLYIGDPNSIHVEPINNISKLSFEPLKIHLYTLIFFASLILFFIIIAKKNKFSEILQSSVFLSVFFSLLLAPNELQWKINDIIRDHAPDFSGWSANDNWNNYQIPNLDHIVTDYLFILIFKTLLLFFLASVFLFILGKLILFILSRNYNLPSPIKNKELFGQIFLFTIFLVYLFMLPQLNYQGPQTIIPPDYDSSSSGYIFHYYSTELDGNEVFNTYGQVGINPLSGYLGSLDINDSFSLQILKESQNSNQQYLQDYLNAKTSEEFNIEGIFYYSQTNFENNIVTVNSTYPFSGFNVEIGNLTEKIQWDDFSSSILNEIEVFSITYSSSTNGSVYKFYFDIYTGWLMRANLILEDQSWSSPNVYDMLKIERAFIVERPDDSSAFQPYRDSTLIMQILTYGILSISVIIFYFFFERSNK